VAEGGGLLNREALSPSVPVCPVEACFVGISAALAPASSGPGPARFFWSGGNSGGKKSRAGGLALKRLRLRIRAGLFALKHSGDAQECAPWNNRNLATFVPALNGEGEGRFRNVATFRRRVCPRPSWGHSYFMRCGGPVSELPSDGFPEMRNRRC
jgi:hypothetical protein